MLASITLLLAVSSIVYTAADEVQQSSLLRSTFGLPRKAPLNSLTAVKKKAAKKTPTDPFASEVDYNDWLRECVPPFKNSGFPGSIPYSNYYLRAAEHGHCADHLSCAFVDCAWNSSTQSILQSSDLSQVDFDSIKDQLPPLNLPDFIAFPKNVKELVLAVNEARKRDSGLISVKSSGHSYHGASTMRDSTQIYLRDFAKYAATGIKECADERTGPCALALARGKKAIIRIGGGEAHDDTYRAVLSWNENHENKYTIIGGGAGTVVAAGGWLQGGGLSTGLERRYGYGVDQILEIEMVLADGTHVKFGPSKWSRDKDFIYPRTTKVDGLCNSNVVDDESQWQWKACSKSIPFADLWFAVRGGGGGTYGIVTAVHAQLHEFKSLFIIYGTPNVVENILGYCQTNDCEAAQNDIFDFFIDLLWNPAGVGISEEISNRFGHPGITFSIPSFSGLFAEGSDAKDAFFTAWQNYVQSTIGAKYPGLALNDLFSAFEVGSFAAAALETSPYSYWPIGHIRDSPPPETQPFEGNLLWSANIPIEWLKQKNDKVHFFLNEIGSCHLMGGFTDKAHDQATSINPFQRVSGLQCMIPFYHEQVFRAEFLPYWNTRRGKFPGGTEYNHIHPYLFGPLKSNWTTPCPLSYTKEEQQKHCVSVQESVWGTDILERLTAIKKRVDPKSNFKCHFCVGEN